MLRSAPIIILLLSVALSSVAQYRSYDRAPELGRSVFMHLPNGQTLLAADQRFGFDSTHIHLFTVDADHVLSHKVSIRYAVPLAYFNDAAPTPDGAVFVGATSGFGTTPFVVRMDTLGNVQWNLRFNGLTAGQDQILSVYADGSALDLFTWSSPASSAFYMLNGNISGSFPNGLRVEPPSGTDFRIDEVAPTGVPGEYLLVGGGEPANGVESIHVIRMDGQGVSSVTTHDHSTTSSFQFEEIHDLILASNGDHLYVVTYRRSDLELKERLVRVDATGAIVWAREYDINGTQLDLGRPEETADGGFLLAVLDDSVNTFGVMKVDAVGVPQWMREYQQMNSTGGHFGWWYRNAQGELLAFNNSYMTETDENVTACDMVQFNGTINSTLVTIPQGSTSYTSTPIVPSTNPQTFEMRSGNFNNTMTCIYSNIAEQDHRAAPLEVFPNPASGWVNVDLSSFDGTTVIGFFDGLGREVKTIPARGGSIRTLFFDGLEHGTYTLRVRNGQKSALGRLLIDPQEIRR